MAKLETGIVLDGYGGTDIVSDINSIRGSTHNDTIIGSDSNSPFGWEHLNGWEGYDVIDGGANGQNTLDFSEASGGHFDPGVVDVFLEIEERIVTIATEHSDTAYSEAIREASPQAGVV